MHILLPCQQPQDTVKRMETDQCNKSSCLAYCCYSEKLTGFQNQPFIFFGIPRALVSLVLIQTPRAYVCSLWLYGYLSRIPFSTFFLPILRANYIQYAEAVHTTSITFQNHLLCFLAQLHGDSACWQHLPPQISTAYMDTLHVNVLVCIASGFQMFWSRYSMWGPASYLLVGAITLKSSLRIQTADVQ